MYRLSPMSAVCSSRKSTFATLSVNVVSLFCSGLFTWDVKSMPTVSNILFSSRCGTVILAEPSMPVGFFRAFARISSIFSSSKKLLSLPANSLPSFSKALVSFRCGVLYTNVYTKAAATARRTMTAATQIPMLPPLPLFFVSMF